MTTAPDENALPRRRPVADRPPGRPSTAATLDDLAILQRVREGLRSLDPDAAGRNPDHIR